MSDELQFYYEQELRYVRAALNREYARKNPEAAAQLKIGPDRIDDPTVRELIDGLALLNARTARKIDDRFPEILEGFFQVLYPHYLRPLPSMAVVQFAPEAAAALPPQGRMLKGASDFKEEATEAPATEIYTLVEGEPCPFRLCSQTHILPIEISHTDFTTPPFQRQAGRAAKHALAALRIRVNSLNETVPLAQLPLSKSPQAKSSQARGLRLFMKEVQPDSHELFEFLFRHLEGIAIYDAQTGKLLQELPPTDLRPVGLDPELSVLKYPPQSFPGFGLLTEFFAYRWRFSFVELLLKPEKFPASVDIVFFFDRSSERLKQHIGLGNVLVNCAAVTNLYQPPPLSIPLDHSVVEYPLLIDRDRIWPHEIYAVDQVELVNDETQESQRLHPIYAQLPGDPVADASLVYSTRREYVEHDADPDMAGSDVFLSAVRLDGNLAENLPQSHLRVSVTALSRNMPSRIEANPTFHLKGGTTGLEVRCVVPPTRTARPKNVSKDRWRLAAHLALNHRSLADREALHSLLTIYDHLGNDDDRKLRRSLRKIASQPVVDRVVRDGRAAFVRGVELALDLDATGLPSGRPYLFATVLAEFFALYCTINSFTKTTASIGGEPVSLPWIVRGEKMVI